MAAFFFWLLLFHPLQWISLKLFGYKGHNWVVNLLNWVLVHSLLILGVRVRFKNAHKLPNNASLILVSNHQSLFDIPPVIWGFRKYHPKFVAKKELEKGIPSISFNLRHGGAALINRKDGRQAMTALASFAKSIHAKKRSAVIFPEGTRSRDGQPKTFATNGIKILVKYNPEAYIVPITINNSWKIFKYGKFPLGIGSPITITAHKAIQVNSLPFDTLIEAVEQTIKNHITPCQ